MSLILISVSLMAEARRERWCVRAVKCRVSGVEERDMLREMVGGSQSWVGMDAFEERTRGGRRWVFGGKEKRGA